MFEEIPQINVHGREKSDQRLILSPASQNMHHTGYEISSFSQANFIHCTNLSFSDWAPMTLRIAQACKIHMDGVING